VLVANRGEIATRVIRTLGERDIDSYVVVSDPDRDSLAVRLATGAVPLGGSAATESYLDIDKIIAAAKHVDADAVHPGYGFLSERTDFALAVEDAGLVFLGPTPDQLAQLGDKLAARQVLAKSGIGPVPGNDDAISSIEEAHKTAERIGYPLLLKAAAGGGGKGIRIVREPGELEGAFGLASSEAQNSFGSPLLFAERYVEGARHVEVQVLGDGRGGVRLFQERDCSIQRRLQKLVEETPCTVVDDKIRERLFQATREAVRATSYRSAGTFEFLLSKEGELFFLEINTRIQVEHPITEEVSGVDLVGMQVDVAEGAELPTESVDAAIVPARGAAIEFRVNAEDPLDRFLPSTGELGAVHLPHAPGLRIDTALVPGTEITPYYDPLIAKVIAYAPTREAALAKLHTALTEMVVEGVATTIPVGVAVLEDEGFRRGDYHCQYLAQKLEDERFLLADLDAETETALAAAFAYARNSSTEAPSESAVPPVSRSRWRRVSE